MTERYAYLTCTEGRSNKHYLVALVEELGKYKIRTGWGAIGKAYRSNKPEPYSDLSLAERAYKAEVQKRLNKGYVIQKDVPTGIPIPDWFNPHSGKKPGTSPKLSPNLVRPDAPWAF